ncbi:MAG: hypothetical protein IJ740_15555, partial [Ruminococcus sp.]|nr:hypothetical protein [Ruminococcus sp.]
MQGIVFTYRKKKENEKFRVKSVKRDFKAILRRWGGVIIFAFTLVLGLAIGCICSGGLSSGTLKNLDFLFMTNMPQRLSGGPLGAFCAGFASDFLFLLAAFLMGLSLWGAAVLPLISFFRGFGIGVSAGYLLLNYGFKGIIFYITVLLPGIIIFAMVLIYELNASLGIFMNICRKLFGKTTGDF